MVASYGYGPYGREDRALTTGDRIAKDDGTQDSYDPINPYRYTQRRFDSGSNTIDMGARRFSPDVSRFIQQDLFMGALDDLSPSFDPLTGNRYALAGGNPTSFIEWDATCRSKTAGARHPRRRRRSR